LSVGIYYILIHCTPILDYLRTSLKTSLRLSSNSKGLQKMTSLNFIEDMIKIYEDSRDTNTIKTFNKPLDDDIIKNDFRGL
jgi:hypothetical protein